MCSFNKVILMGSLTRDPVLSVTNVGISICRFCIAINSRFTPYTGEIQEEITVIDVVAFGRKAEIIANLFSKAQPIHIEGSLRLVQWEDKNKEIRSKLSVVLEGFKFISLNGKIKEDNIYEDKPSY